MRRHDGARDILAKWCEEHHCTVQREVILSLANPQRPEARMDLVVRTPDCTSPAYIDVSIVSALAAQALAGGSSKHHGKAAELAAKEKRKDYPQVNVSPFIVEDHGRFGDDAVAFLKRLAPPGASARSRAMGDL